MFVIPVETVGVSTSPLFTQAGERTNVLYLDDVTVTEASRVGDEGTGMQIMLEAVDFERLTLAGPELRPTVEWLLAEATKRANFHDAMEIDLLEMLADASAAELLGLYAALRHDDGKSITIESAMLKLWTAELRGRIADVGLQCFGDSALLVGREADAPREGYLANLYQAFPLFRFGAGGIEVLKDVVAQRGFGMPRNR
jgi:alkylation response protein AidB-like acyl-CoA dehydrogenase